MERPLTAYKIALVIFAVSILVIAVLSVLPLVQEDITVEPGQQGVTWGVKEEELIGEGNIWINNSGNFDLEDISLALDLEALDDLYLTTTEELDEIKVGEDRKVNLRLSKNLSAVSNEVIDHLIYNDTDFEITAKFEGRYTFSLMSFDVSYRDTFLLERVVNDIDYDVTDADLFSDASGNQRLSLPVYLSTNDNELISGDVSIYTAIYDEDEANLYSEDVFTHTLGRDETIDLNFNVSDTDARELVTTSQTLVIKTNISLERYDFSVRRHDTFSWRAPLNGLQIKNITYQDENETVTGRVSFHNDAAERVELTLSAKLYNDEGEVIGDFEEDYRIGADENFEEYLEIDVDREELVEFEVEMVLERRGYIHRRVYEL
ncbi:MAG: hypothetical protein V5A88_01255 [Candidatus Thermoplasmatota archaeon]